MLRLRQICLVAPELNKSVAHLESTLGLKTCFQFALEGLTAVLKTLCLAFEAMMHDNVRA